MPPPDVIEVEPRTDPRWDAYVGDHRSGTVYHRSGWLAALAREYPRTRQACLAVADGERLRGVLPLQWTTGLPLAPAGIAGRRLASLPRTPVCGPLADDDETTGALLAEAVARAEADGARLQIKTAQELPAASRPAGTESHPWREAFVLELPGDEAEVRFGNSRNHSRIRWAVNKARKSGVRVREASSADDVRRWYPSYLEALRFNGVPPRPLRLFLALWEELRPAGEMTLLLAENDGGALLGGSIVLEHGETAFYAFNGVLRSALSLRPNDVVQWEAIHHAVRNGRRRYDLGEVVEHHEGLADFKRKWGGEPHRLHRLYAPPPGAAPDPGGGPPEAALKAYRRLPLPLTAAIGTTLYRFL